MLSVVFLAPVHSSCLCILKEMIHLEGIPNLSGLVQSFDQQQLANFCRILSVTISEPDVGNDDKHTLLAKNAQQKRNASPSRAEVNQGKLTLRGSAETACVCTYFVCKGTDQ